MQTTSAKFYPTVAQAIHLLMLYIFIQTIIDFPLAIIDYFNDTDYLYHPVKKFVNSFGVTLFILWYGFRNTGSRLSEVFPAGSFSLLILLPLITFLIAVQHLLNGVNMFVAKAIPPPMWFWELFNNIFESRFGFWGAFFKVAIIAPVVEELIFRGVILHGLARNYSRLRSVVLSALLFALFHLNPWQLPATFVLGLLLGWIMVYTRNIYLAIAGHSLNNLLVLLSITYSEQLQTLLPLPENSFLISVAAAIVALLSVAAIHFLMINRRPAL